MELRTIKTRLPKAIKRITILKSDGSQSAERGSLGRVVVKQKRKRKKKSKGMLRIFEKIAEGNARSNRSTAEDYLSRHRRSNRKKRDGWLRDWSYNWMRARRKGGKKFKLSKVFS